MDFEWHGAKNEGNVEKHGIDFHDAAHVFSGPHFTEDRTREEDGEKRRAAIGPVPDDVVPDHWSGLLIVVIFTMRGDTTRIISARRADSDERRRYQRHFGGREAGRE